MDNYFQEIWEIFNQEKNKNIPDTEKENLLMDVFFRMKKQIKEEMKSKLKNDLNLLLNEY